MNNEQSKTRANVSISDIVECVSILETIVEHTDLLAELTEEQRVALLSAAGRISRPDKKEIKKRQKEVKFFRQKQMVELSRLKRAYTGIRSAREASVFVAPEQLKIESD